jgi:hypothetical protein
MEAPEEGLTHGDSKKRKRSEEEDSAGGGDDLPAQAERGRLLLSALLVIPQGELDDTHFDKLQSRLVSFCQGSPQLLAAFLQVGAVETITVRHTSRTYPLWTLCCDVR